MKKLVALVSALVLCGSLAVAALVASSAPSFARARSYATGGCCPSSVAIGDLNGDGKTDLVAANGGRPPNPTNTVSVLLNRGNGSFQAELDYPTGPNPSSVAIGDLNGDGKADLAAALEVGSEVAPHYCRGVVRASACAIGQAVAPGAGVFPSQ